MNGETLRLPPGPKPLPIIGNLYLVRSLPNRSLHRLSQTYGPVMYLKLGVVPTVVISSPELAELVLKTHDLHFSNRVPSHFGRLFGSKGFAFIDYGSYWRAARKLAVSQVLSAGKVMSFSSIMEEELLLFIKNLKDFISDDATTDHFVSVKNKVASLTGNTLCKITLGRRCMNEKINGTGLSFGDLCGEIIKLLSHHNIYDHLPIFNWLDVHGVCRRGKVVLRLVRGFIDLIIDEHVAKRESNEKSNSSDFIDFLLSVMHDKKQEWMAGFDFDRSHIISIVLDTIIGATDTLPSSFEWVFVEVVRNQAVMEKLKRELKKVIGNDRERMIKVSDLPELKYLAMVVKGELEVASRDCKVWENAEEFIPERFEDDHEVDVRGSDFRVLPFGSGRRACPGMNFSLTMISLVLANLIHSFDWQLPDGISPSQIDMQEKYDGLVIALVTPLLLKPTPKP
ncbi:cytochrome P450 71AU50-like [Dioscorea cayenensis subsp. rotundata]|uniref:Cytochrome P450 71AU50-like n=1 Tax=Dioscorea cayennensis subsp. rotundata TaxID=55577 RepID=A0AB40B2M3_DIOCR|nr:cytochrome P450 71AU50-like [Dioscorea cayenensis subsp. rotundata]